MKIGLLECDHVREEFLSIAGDYRDMFPALFMPLAPDWEFVFYDVVNGHIPVSVAECDAYICTGSRYSVYENILWIDTLKAFVQQLYIQQKTYIGVCFGHQLLAEALGGQVQKASTGWCVGVHTLSNIENPMSSPLQLLMMCQDQVVQLPPDSTILASIDACSVAMFRVGNRMLGIQAHPEFSVAYEEALLRSRVERIGIEKVENALISLSTPIDSALMAKWMVDFVNNPLTFVF